MINLCQQCGSHRLQSKSFGTERVEEEIKGLFPEARVARMDVDTMKGKQSMGLLLDDLKHRRVDILVGTQMVVKGLDFARVSLVGILSADSLLSYPDFRVNERAFQLMEQVSGRAGRADGEGLVLVQAVNAEHPVLGWVKAHDVRAYFNHEIRYREFFGYPPFSRLIKISFKHENEAKAQESAQIFADALRTDVEIQVQGPVPALIPRLRGLYVQEVWIKCSGPMKHVTEVKQKCRDQRQLIGSMRGFGKVQVLFDVDPV
jgi:primosomal protein N' (replication factor Y)